MRNIDVRGYREDQVPGMDARVAVMIHADGVGILAQYSIHLTAAQARELAASLMAAAAHAGHVAEVGAT